MNARRIRDLEKQIGFLEHFIKEYQKLLKEERDHETRSELQGQLELCMDDHDKLTGELFFANLKEQQNG